MTSAAALPNREPSDRFSVVSHGVDQIEFAFRGVAGDLAALIDRAERKSARRLQDRKIGWFSWGLFGFSTKTPAGWVEVRPDEPMSVSILGFSEMIASELMKNAGVTSHDPPTIKRVDLSTDVQFEDPSESQRVLQALTAVTPARHKMSVFYGTGSTQIETVVWATETDGIRLRVYDKSIQTGEGQGLLRFERQQRPRARDQRNVAEVQAMDLAEEVVRPLRLGANDGLLVADLTGLHQRLLVLRDDEVVSQTRAERLLGTLLWAREGGPGSWGDARTARLRKRELEDLGLALHPQLVEPYDLGPVLAAVQVAWR